MKARWKTLFGSKAQVAHTVWIFNSGNFQWWSHHVEPLLLYIRTRIHSPLLPIYCMFLAIPQFFKLSSQHILYISLENIYTVYIYMASYGVLGFTPRRNPQDSKSARSLGALVHLHDISSCLCLHELHRRYLSTSTNPQAPDPFQLKTAHEAQSIARHRLREFISEVSQICQSLKIFQPQLYSHVFWTWKGFQYGFKS